MSDGLELLQYVFAGLVASWVFYGLTPYREPQPFNRVVRALIYTAVIQLSAEFIVALSDDGGWQVKSVAAANGGARLAASPLLVWLLSFGLGFALALMANNNWPHKWLIRFPPEWKWTKWLWRVTNQSSHENNLSYTMWMRRGDFIVLALKNGRRVYGWPDSWPDHPDEDFFLLSNYEWLPGARDDPAAVAAANQKIPPKGAILISAKDVDVIEFVPDAGMSPAAPVPINTSEENTP